MVNPFLKRTLEMWDGFGAAPEPHLRTQVVSASLTSSATVAWHSDFKSNSIPYAETTHAISNRFDHSRRLVSKGKRSNGLQITIAKVLVVGHV